MITPCDSVIFCTFAVGRELDFLFPIFPDFSVKQQVEVMIFMKFSSTGFVYSFIQLGGYNVVNCK